MAVELSLVSQVQKTTEHFYPKFIGWVGLVDAHRGVVPQTFYYGKQVFEGLLFLEDREVESSDGSVGMSVFALNVYILAVEAGSLES